MTVSVLVASEEEQTKELFSFFLSLKTEEEQEKEKEQPKELVELLSVVVKEFSVAFKKAEIPQLEGAFNLFVSLAQQTKKEEKTTLFTSLVSEITRDHGDERLVLRLKFLNNIFNAETDGKIRYNALLNIACLSLSSSSSSSSSSPSSLLVSQLSKISGWVGEWGLEKEERVRLYKAIVSSLKKDEKNQLNLYEFLLKILKKEEELGEELEEEAVEAVVLALKLAEIKDFDEISELKIVLALEKGEHKLLLELLNIFIRGNVHDFTNFKKGNDEIFAKYGLDANDLLLKIRLITIAVLGSKNKNLLFSELEKELEVEEGEVEEWVVEGVERGYVVGKLDDLTGVFHVRQAHLRLFGKEEWKELQKELVKTEKNLNFVFNSLEKSLSSSSFGRK